MKHVLATGRIGPAAPDRRDGRVVTMSIRTTLPAEGHVYAARHTPDGIADGATLSDLFVGVRRLRKRDGRAMLDNPRIPSLAQTRTS